MTLAAIIAISVLAYLIVGIATAVLEILTDGEPKGDEEWALLLVVLLWFIVLPIVLPVWIARRIEARRAASCEKPKVFEEYEL